MQPSEANFKASLSNSPLGIRIVSEDGETLYTNSPFLDIYGYKSLKEFNATPVKDRYTPDSYVEFQARRDKRRRKEPLPDNYEVSIVRKNGDVRHLQVLRKEIMWSGKMQYQTIYRDVTEHKHMEEAVRESEEKFRYVFDNSAIGKSLTSISGEIHVNKAFCELLGYSVEELVHKTWQEITHPDDINLTQKAIDSLVSGQVKTVRFNKRYLHKNGSNVWTDVQSSLRHDETGKPLYLITSIMDITERKKAEEALRQSEERFRNTVQYAPVGVATVGPDRKFITAIYFTQPGHCKLAVQIIPNHLNLLIHGTCLLPRHRLFPPAYTVSFVNHVPGLFC